MTLTKQLGYVLPVITLVMLLVTGCAKAPSGGVGPTSGTILVSFTVLGRIRPDYSYFVLFNNTSTPNSSPGPIPVVSAPWGNGFAAGEFTHFVKIDASLPNNGYGVFSVVPGTNLRSFNNLGSPTQSSPITSTSSTVSFELPLSELATTAVPAASINALQINIITTDRIPVDPNDPNPKLFDALGDGRNRSTINAPITIFTQQAGIYQNSTSVSPEPAGDVAQVANNGNFINVSEPDLDIIDWHVEIRR